MQCNAGAPTGAPCRPPWHPCSPAGLACILPVYPGLGLCSLTPNSIACPVRHPCMHGRGWWGGWRKVAQQRVAELTSAFLGPGGSCARSGRAPSALPSATPSSSSTARHGKQSSAQLVIAARDYGSGRKRLSRHNPSPLSAPAPPPPSNASRSVSGTFCLLHWKQCTLPWAGHGRTWEGCLGQTLAAPAGISTVSRKRGQDD